MTLNSLTAFTYHLLSVTTNIRFKINLSANFSSSHGRNGLSHVEYTKNDAIRRSGGHFAPHVSLGNI